MGLYTQVKWGWGYAHVKISKKLPISLTNLSKKAARRHDITLVLYNHGSSAHSGKRKIVCVCDIHGVDWWNLGE